MSLGLAGKVMGSWSIWFRGELGAQNRGGCHLFGQRKDGLLTWDKFLTQKIGMKWLEGLKRGHNWNLTPASYNVCEGDHKGYDLWWSRPRIAVTSKQNMILGLLQLGCVTQPGGAAWNASIDNYGLGKNEKRKRWLTSEDWEYYW